MFSRKTTWLQSQYRKYEISCQMRDPSYILMMAVHTSDTRYRDASEALAVSHDFVEMEAEQFESMSDLLIHVAACAPAYRPRHIFVDEGQFMVTCQADYDATLSLVEEYGIDVSIATLRADAERRPWPFIPELIACADQIVDLCAICVTCGGDAHHTKRLLPAPAVVDVGGADKYIPMCRLCHIESDRSGSPLRDSPDVQKYVGMRAAKKRPGP